MATKTKQQIIKQMDAPELIEFEETVIKEQIERVDDKARDYRKHLAQEKALRQLEKRKAHALAAVHRMSFIR
jgi:5-bromo-4-chloroindolyl phosphate hydrolysis protein